MTDKLSALIESFKRQLEDGNKIDPDAAREMLLAITIDTHNEVKQINGRLKKVEKVVEDVKRFPSLWWLLRHKTKQTIGITLIVIALTVLIFVPELRAPIMEWLGLPPLLP